MTPSSAALSQGKEDRRRLLDDLIAARRATAPRVAAGPAPSRLLGREHNAALEDLDRRKAALTAAGLTNPYFRQIDGIASGTATIDGQSQINFSSYNYLGFSGDPEVSAAAKRAIDDYGTSVSASRIASGERGLHRSLERALAEIGGAEDAIVMVSGHATNVATIGHLFGPSDLLLHDALIHNSILIGCQLSGAARIAFPHNDIAAAERILREKRRSYDRAVLLVEGVYSMDGDIAPLPDILELKRRHDLIVFVDEAHSLGVLGKRGRGLAEHFDVDPSVVDFWMGTLSKSLAGCGGYIAALGAVVDYLKYSVPGFVFSVGLSPPLAAASLRAIELMHQQPDRVARLQSNATHFAELARAAGLDLGTSGGTAVVPVMVGSSQRALAASHALASRGINVQPAMYPAVPEDGARLRFFISSLHEHEQIGMAVRLTAEVLAALPP
jgi:8-amino-7-oxononanoate synthase